MQDNTPFLLKSVKYKIDWKALFRPLAETSQRQNVLLRSSHIVVIFYSETNFLILQSFFVSKLQKNSTLTVIMIIKFFLKMYLWVFSLTRKKLCQLLSFGTIISWGLKFSFFCFLCCLACWGLSCLNTYFPLYLYTNVFNFSDCGMDCVCTWFSACCSSCIYQRLEVYIAKGSNIYIYIFENLGRNTHDNAKLHPYFFFTKLKPCSFNIITIFSGGLFTQKNKVHVFVAPTLTDCKLPTLDIYCLLYVST